MSFDQSADPAGFAEKTSKCGGANRDMPAISRAHPFDSRVTRWRRLQTGNPMTSPIIALQPPSIAGSRIGTRRRTIAYSKSLLKYVPTDPRTQSCGQKAGCKFGERIAAVKQRQFADIGRWLGRTRPTMRHDLPSINLTRLLTILRNNHMMY